MNATRHAVGITLPPAMVGPVPEDHRILALDALRSLAILGILAMNIQLFSETGATYFNPTATGPIGAANY